MLTIHPDASKRFNELGFTLVRLCKERTYPRRNDRSQKFHFPKPYTAEPITEKDVSGELMPSMVDSTGKTIGRYFGANGKLVGLGDEDYIKFAELCEAICKALRPSSITGITLIETECFNWIRDYFRRDTTITLLDFILPKIESQISELTVWVPIAQLHIESNIKIGKVEFRPISEELIASWRDDLISRLLPSEMDEKSKNIREFFDLKFTKIMQGGTASVIQVIAEPNAARELAIFETQRSLSVLRLFSDAAIIPAVNCYVSIMGQENIESIISFMFKANLFSSYEQSLVDNSQRPWHVTDSFVVQLHKLGLLDILSSILESESPSKFQESILDSVILYSEATRGKEYSNKLIYILSALEGIFLKDSNEPIQQNLGERMAVLIGKNLDERKRIIGNLKSIYGLRSSFLHHAHSIENNKEFAEFMFNAYRAITNTIGNQDRFSTKQEFVSAIDDKKLG